MRYEPLKGKPRHYAATLCHYDERPYADSAGLRHYYATLAARYVIATPAITPVIITPQPLRHESYAIATPFITP